MRLFTKRTYLDHASATPVTKRAQKSYMRALSIYGNPSSPHKEGVVAAQALAAARVVIAREVEAKPDDIIFTSSATEANNLAIHGVVGSKKSAHVLYMPSSHASILEPVQALARTGVLIEPLQVTEGVIDIEKLKSQIRPETVLVSMDRVCGETGALWDTRAVRRVLDGARTSSEPRILLHVDALHAPRIESVERTRIAGDLITFDAQKVGGVRGAAALVVNRTISLEPLLMGGSQERALSPGTENLAAITAFAEAFSEAKENRAAFVVRAQQMRSQILDAISEIPEVYENRGKEQAPHILNISFVGRDTDYLVALLDVAGFATSTKSACETDSLEGSRAVYVLTGDSSRAEATLRISFGAETSTGDVRRFVQALSSAISFLDSHTL